MKRFQFSLERLRRLRESEFEREEERLRMLISEFHSLEAARVQVLEQEAEALRLFSRRREVSSEDLDELQLWRAYANREVARLAASLQEIHRRIDEQRGRLLVAHQKLEALSLLKDRRHAEWRKEVENEQEQMVGDLVVARWKRDGE